MVGFFTGHDNNGIEICDEHVHNVLQKLKDGSFLDRGEGKTTALVYFAIEMMLDNPQLCIMYYGDLTVNYFNDVVRDACRALDVNFRMANACCYEFNNSILHYNTSTTTSSFNLASRPDAIEINDKIELRSLPVVSCSRARNPEIKKCLWFNRAPTFHDVALNDYLMNSHKPSVSSDTSKKIRNWSMMTTP